jgi:hypothetical protein
MEIRPDIATLDKGLVSDGALSNYNHLSFKSNVRYTVMSPQGVGDHSKDQSFCDNLARIKKIGFLAREMFGQFESDDDYLLALSILLASTKETAHRKSFLNKISREKIRDNANVIDIGVGTGEITPYFCDRLKSITLVDTNKSALNQIRLKELFPHLEVRKISDSVLNIELENSFYDAVVVSHVLYYLPPSLWKKCLDMLYSSLREKGIITVVLSGEGDKRFLAHSFGGVEYDINLPVDILSSYVPNGYQLEVYDMHEVCTANCLEHAICIASIYLNDAKTTAKKQDLIDHVSHFNRVGSGYKFEFIQRFILLQKV